MSLPAFSTLTSADFNKSPTPLPPHPSNRPRPTTFVPKPKPTTVVSWTSSISHHCRNGQIPEAVAAFSHMAESGLHPNEITIITLLSGCADFPSKTESLRDSVHGFGRKLGLVKEDVMVGTAVVDMYAKCGRVDLARKVFDEMGVRNSVTWNTMIDGYMKSGYAYVGDAIQLFDEMPMRLKDAVTWTVLINGFVKMGRFEEALDLFREMQVSGIEPDYVTIIAVLAACANLGTLGLGLWMNRLIVARGFEGNVRICNSLMDMYSRGGGIEFAKQVFERMSDRTVVSWNTIIVGCAANGNAEDALQYFERMKEAGLEPDGVSFTGALTSCSHAGFVDKGLGYFHLMKNIYGIRPRIEHFGCLVDLYSRAGRLEDAMEIIENMPMKPNEVVLGSLLAACRIHEDVSLAERLMKYLVKLDPSSDSNYILLANIYANAGKWDDSNKVRRRMKMLGIPKTPGFSSVEIDCVNHEFVAGDRSHPDMDNIERILDLLSFELKPYSCVNKTITRELYEND